MALPLIYALKDAGHQVILPSNQAAHPFYEFLAREGIISGISTYRHGSFRSWLEGFGNVDRLILPAGVEFHHHPLLWAIRKRPFFARAFLRLKMNVKSLEIIPDVYVKGEHSRLSVSNRAQSYIQWMGRYGVAFKPETLFFQEDVLKKARLRAEKIIFDQGLRAHQYAVLYPATARSEKNIPLELLNEIIRYFSNSGLKLVLIGDSSHGGYPPLRDANLIDLRGRRDFEELVGLFSLSRVVLAVDGGLLHLALASRAKTVSFWGATIPDSLVMPNHPYHHPLCRYLPFQPYEGEKITDAQRAEAFDFSIEEIVQAMRTPD